MSFATTQFLAFFGVLLLLYYTVPRRWQWKLLLAGSLFFYWFAGWWCLIYIGVTAATTWLAARRMEDLAREQDVWFREHKAGLSKEERKAWKARGKSRRFRWLLGCLLVNFGILAVVKYTNFVIGNLNGLAAALGGGQPLPTLSLVLPMGISFYTFQAMGYLIDVYWGKCPAERSLGRFALFVTFFPQLIQGPISRFGDLSRTLYAEHPWDSRQIAMGAERVLWGLAKKLIVADRLAIPLRTLVSDPDQYRGVYVLAVIFLYAVQLYADFTGGIDITIGAAQMLGVRVTENFQRPFFSKNAAEYWRRWHITMGTWFRDYLFYPMSVSKPILKLHQRCRNRFGGVGKRVSVHTCSIILWFVTGLWHGASWNFIVWGLLNGIVIIISQELEPLYDKFHARFPRLRGRGPGSAYLLADGSHPGAGRVPGRAPHLPAAGDGVHRFPAPGAVGRVLPGAGRRDGRLAGGRRRSRGHAGMQPAGPAGAGAGASGPAQPPPGLERLRGADLAHPDLRGVRHRLRRHPVYLQPVLRRRTA